MKDLALVLTQRLVDGLRILLPRRVAPALRRELGNVHAAEQPLQLHVGCHRPGVGEDVKHGTQLLQAPVVCMSNGFRRV